jgi:RNA polymerase sigma-70 factor (ECF subfamily)
MTGIDQTEGTGVPAEPKPHQGDTRSNAVAAENPAEDGTAKDRTAKDTTAKDRAAAFAILVQKVAETRDQSAFEEVFDYFAPRLKAYLLRLGAPAGQAEELVQEVMLTLWRKADLFDPTKASLSTWLFRVARNRHIDSLRRDQRGDLDEEDPYLQPEGEVDAGEQMDANLRDKRVRQCLDALPEEQLLLVRLAFFKGLSHSQIAEEADLPLGTVKSRIRLAFSRLRRSLETDPQIDLD